MEDLLSFKKQILWVNDLIKSDKIFGNELLAQLNDFAYKQIRKSGL